MVTGKPKMNRLAESEEKNLESEDEKMQVDLEKLTSFGLSGKKDICFTIDDKKVSYRVPYCVFVNESESKLYTGKNSFDDSIELSKKDIEAIFSGDETVIELACKNYIASKFKNKYYVGG